MRRSGAPSFKKQTNGRENTTNIVPTPQEPANAVRSISQILSLLNKGPSSDENTVVRGHNMGQHKSTPSLSANVEEQADPTTSESASEKKIFEAVYRKRTTKKNKTWEGDGTVEIEGRKAVLKNEEGTVLGRLAQIKSTIIMEEGAMLQIGGLEVQLESLKSITSASEPPQSKATSSSTPRSPPYKKQKLLVPADDFPLPTPSAVHQWTLNASGAKVNRIAVEGFLARVLRPHQKEGVTFLYECVMGMRDPNVGPNRGAILADATGLGKTLQCIALLWTLLRQKQYGDGVEVKRALIICPKTLVGSWEKDIYGWLQSRVRVYKVDREHTLEDYTRKSNAKIAVVSYSAYSRISEEERAKIAWDLIICDEAHCLKNPATIISMAVRSIVCRRKILLTATPCQNNLHEYFQLLDIANPGCLGTKEEFNTRFKMPIQRGIDVNASSEDIEEANSCRAELNDLTSQFMLRRTGEVNMRYLPPKTDLVIMCKMTKLQKHLYQSATRYIESHEMQGEASLKAIASLRQLCNHPALMTTNNCSLIEETIPANLQCYLQEIMPNAIDLTDENYSGKLQVVLGILQTLMAVRENSKERDRVLLISYSKGALNMMEQVCNKEGIKTCKLTGDTPANKRQQIIKEFNRPDSNIMVFLLSSKAGGIGVTVTGASRLILLDSDWNPANDAQALGRNWRGDQKRPVITYRLVTADTIEEINFRRLVRKAQLDPMLQENEDPKFSDDDLKDLFSYTCEGCRTHTLLQCGCEGTGTNVEQLPLNPDDPSDTIPGITNLMRWQHFFGDFNLALMEELSLLYSYENISCMFLSKVQVVAASNV